MSATVAESSRQKLKKICKYIEREKNERILDDGKWKDIEEGGTDW